MGGAVGTVMPRHVHNAAQAMRGGAGLAQPQKMVVLPNIPQEQTGASVGFFAMCKSLSWRPPFSGGVRCLKKRREKSARTLQVRQ